MSIVEGKRKRERKEDWKRVLERRKGENKSENKRIGNKERLQRT